MEQRRIDNKDLCQCDFCRTHDRYIWATVMECGCGCHRGDDHRPHGHESLCCEYPNGKQADNPYTDLRPASDYNKILRLLEKQGNIWPIERLTMEDKEYADLQNQIDNLIQDFKI